MCHLRKVHFQHIGFDHVELAVQAQAGRQVAVELDDGEAAQALDQRLRERGQARADLDHGLAGARVDGADDGVDDAAVAEEVLAEALARDVLAAAAHWGGSRNST